LDKWGEPFLDAQGLAKLLLTECDILDTTADLDRSAQFYIKQKGASALLDLLHNKFNCHTIQSYHEVILSLPWKRIYTTNYDNIVEKFSENKQKLIHHYDSDNQPKGFPEKGTICYYINGRLKTASQDDLMDKIKLT